jgi:uncharacterized membrane protein
MDQKAEVIAEALKGAPAVGAATAVIAGFNLNTVLVVLTIVYIFVQIGYLLHRWYRMSRRPNTFRHEEVDH